MSLKSEHAAIGALLDGIPVAGAPRKDTLRQLQEVEVRLSRLVSRLPSSPELDRQLALTRATLDRVCLRLRSEN
jgi:hypothetical protein